MAETRKYQGSFYSSSLANLLSSQKVHIKSALPSGVTNLIGVGDFDHLGRQAIQAAAAPAKKKPGPGLP